MPRRITGLTLIELVIAITLLSVIVLGLANIDSFSRYHVLTAERRATVQNEVSFVLGQMTKEIGNRIQPLAELAWWYNKPTVGPSTVVRGEIKIDANKNGRDDSGDHSIYYIYTKPSLRYCSNSTGYICSSVEEVLSSKITNFYPNNPFNENYTSVNITACWDPQEKRARCGTPDNPSVTMETKIKMPLVSVDLP